MDFEKYNKRPLKEKTLFRSRRLQIRGLKGILKKIFLKYFDYSSDGSWQYLPKNLKLMDRDEPWENNLKNSSSSGSFFNSWLEVSYSLKNNLKKIEIYS